MSGSTSTKVHHYPMTFRSCAMTGGNLCSDKAILYLVPPDNAISIEQLYIHIKMTFDASVAAGNQVLEAIAIGNSIPLFADRDPDYFRKIVLNQAADGSRKIDVRVDLSSLLKKSNVGYRDFFNDPGTNDFTYVYLKFKDTMRGVSPVGTIQLWKLDGLFTTKGIR